MGKTKKTKDQRLKTYGQLKQDQRCLYEAFSNIRGCPDAPNTMGTIVNTAGHDADASQAVSVLAERYGFIAQNGCTGEFFKNSATHRASSELIVAITMNNDAVDMTGIYHQERNPTAAHTILASSDDNILWHAVYATTRRDGTVYEYRDQQGLRREGPRPADFVVYFERPEATEPSKSEASPKPSSGKSGSKVPPGKGKSRTGRGRRY